MYGSVSQSCYTHDSGRPLIPFQVMERHAEGCVCVCVCVCVSVGACVCVWLCVCARACVSTGGCVHACMCSCICVCVCVCVHVLHRYACAGLEQGSPLQAARAGAQAPACLVGGGVQGL